MMVCSQCLAGHRLVQVEHILFVVRRHLLRKEIWREVKLIRCLLRPELHVSGCPRWMSIIVMKHHDRKQSYLVREGFIGLHISVTVRHQKSQGSSFSVLSASSNNTHTLCFLLKLCQWVFSGTKQLALIISVVVLSSVSYQILTFINKQGRVFYFSDFNTEEKQNNM